MISYFTLISHHLPNERHNFYEDIQRNTGKLSIGWGEVNPIGSTPERIRSQIEYEYNPAGLNVTNGVESLALFSALQVGDIVFMRGNAAVIDIAIITGAPTYFYGEGHDGLYDYCTKIKFSPFLNEKRFELRVSQIPEGFHHEFVFDEGRSRTMKRISEDMAVVLIQRIAALL